MQTAFFSTVILRKHTKNCTDRPIFETSVKSKIMEDAGFFPWTDENRKHRFFRLQLTRFLLGKKTNLSYGIIMWPDFRLL